MIKTNEQIIHLINGLMAAECVDNEKQKKYMITTLSRLLNKSSMGELFKVIFAYKGHNKKFFGFE